MAIRPAGTGRAVPTSGSARAASPSSKSRATSVTGGSAGSSSSGRVRVPRNRATPGSAATRAMKSGVKTASTSRLAPGVRT